MANKPQMKNITTKIPPPPTHIFVQELRIYSVGRWNIDKNEVQFQNAVLFSYGFFFSLVLIFLVISYLS